MKENVLLVGFVFPDNGDVPTAVIGAKRPREKLDVINIITGDEVENLYKLLTVRKSPEKKQKEDMERHD